MQWIIAKPPNDSRISPFGDACFVEAELAKNLFRMLPERRGGTLDVARRLLEMNRYAGHPDGSDQRMVNDRIHLHCGDLQIVEKFQIVLDRAAGDAFPDQQRFPFGRGFLAEEWLQDGSQFFTPFRSLAVRVVARVPPIFRDA